MTEFPSEGSTFGRRKFLKNGAIAALLGMLPTSLGMLDSLWAAEQEADLVVTNGWLMDPLTDSKVLADLHVAQGKILRWADCGSTVPNGATVINADGLVVAPGFIDIHSHEGLIEKTMECFVLDGVTTMLGGNCGESPYPLGDFFDSLEHDGALINYAGHVGANLLRQMAGVAEDAAATPAQIETMVQLAGQELAAGAMGVSYGIQYQPAACWEEIAALGMEAARHRAMTAAHSRDGGVGQSALDALEEMIRLARETGVPHQYSHIGSMLAYGENMVPALKRIDEVQEQGLRFCTDIYGYDASMASINASQLDESVFDRFACEPQDLELLDDVSVDGLLYMTGGSRFSSREQYFYLRQKTFEGRVDAVPVIIAHLQDETSIRLAMQSPWSCICSDGIVFESEPGHYAGHPRVAGAFARWLGRYVRDQGVVPLMQGLFKASTMPALILGLSNKGRLTSGADADLVVFDPVHILDQATYGEGFMRPPVGIAYVVVNGVLTAVKGELVSGAKGGRPLRRTWEVPGYERVRNATHIPSISLLLRAKE